MNAAVYASEITWEKEQLQVVKKCGFCRLKEICGALQDDSSRFLLLFAVIGKRKEYSEHTELMRGFFKVVCLVLSQGNNISGFSKNYLLRSCISGHLLSSSLFGEAFLSTSSVTCVPVAIHSLASSSSKHRESCRVA